MEGIRLLRHNLSSCESLMLVICLFEVSLTTDLLQEWSWLCVSSSGYVTLHACAQCACCDVVVTFVFRLYIVTTVLKLLSTPVT